MDILHFALKLLFLFPSLISAPSELLHLSAFFFLFSPHLLHLLLKLKTFSFLITAVLIPVSSSRFFFALPRLFCFGTLLSSTVICIHEICMSASRRAACPWKL